MQSSTLSRGGFQIYIRSIEALKSNKHNGIMGIIRERGQGKQNKRTMMGCMEDLLISYLSTFRGSRDRDVRERQPAPQTIREASVGDLCVWGCPLVPGIGPPKSIDYLRPKLVCPVARCPFIGLDTDRNLGAGRPSRSCTYPS